MIVNNNTQNPSLTFGKHCPQIRDGEWVCHTINTELPHFSTSKFKPIFQKKLRYYCGSWFIPKNPMSMRDIYEYSSIIVEEHAKKDKAGIIKKTLRKIAQPFFPKNTERDYQIIEKIKYKIAELGIKRMNCANSSEKCRELNGSIKLLQDYNLGNCYENAVVAELILKLNGIKNARTLYIKNNNTTEHSVCVFNRDGSEFKEIVNNKTIFIDPWAQKTDFANKMLTHLKNNFGNNLSLDGKKGLSYETHEFAKLTQTEIEELRNKYPEFIFNSKKRKFMDN